MQNFVRLLERKHCKMKAARLNDIAHGRTGDHALSSEKELQDSRKDQLSQRKDETNEYRRNSREIGRNSKLLQSRDSSIAGRKLLNITKMLTVKGSHLWTVMVMLTVTVTIWIRRQLVMKMRLHARVLVIMMICIKQIQSSVTLKGKFRGRMSKKQDERAELMKTRAGKRMELEAVQKSHAQVEGRLANAMESRDKAQVAYDEDLATGNDAMVGCGEGRLDSAVANVAKFEQQLQDSQNDVNAAEKEVEAVDLQLDANNEAIAADDAELDVTRW